MAPEPGFVGRVLGEFEAERSEAFDLGVEVFAFEVERDGRRSFGVDWGHTPYRSCFCLRRDVHRQSRFAVRTLKPCISRQGIDNANQAELFKKLDRLDGEVAVDSDLVEVHGFMSCH